ncbi:hypothetical protein ACFY9F_35940 [Streptomyces sp. NPDC012421]|uniref:hypothetical protein n=1 Tax=Streptomyces sp. NPDC012421 TaxID=3364832 RepID=UPI0036E264CB
MLWGATRVRMGIGVEVMLLTGLGRDASVSDEQRTWTLTLWNPWFIAGGTAFGLAALHAGRKPA